MNFPLAIAPDGNFVYRLAMPRIASLDSKLAIESISVSATAMSHVGANVNAATAETITGIEEKTFVALLALDLLLKGPKHFFDTDVAVFALSLVCSTLPVAVQSNYESVLPVPAPLVGFSPHNDTTLTGAGSLFFCFLLVPTALLISEPVE
jgi:hypothetical protein